jgi:hypothetical protein
MIAVSVSIVYVYWSIGPSTGKVGATLLCCTGVTWRRSTCNPERVPWSGSRQLLTIDVAQYLNITDQFVSMSTVYAYTQTTRPGAVIRKGALRACSRFRSSTCTLMCSGAHSYRSVVANCLILFKVQVPKFENNKVSLFRHVTKKYLFVYISSPLFPTKELDRSTSVNKRLFHCTY